MKAIKKSLKIDFPIYVDYTFDGKFYNVTVKFGVEEMYFSTEMEENIKYISKSMCESLIKYFNA